MSKELQDQGAKVWITGRNEERLMETAAKIGAQGFVADTADGEAWDRLMKEVMADSGRLDILVNNAGEGVNIAPTGELSDEVIERSIASNLTGAFTIWPTVQPMTQL
ncbi:MAG: SDR family oxidoreductase [Verrucomicrobia bacterium]|nr:SDR family oxidoreductase [Verrucomicrobiota bacterium]